MKTFQRSMVDAPRLEWMPWKGNTSQKLFRTSQEIAIEPHSSV